MSDIDLTVPAFGNATTQSVRDNFATAATEIDGLSAAIAALRSTIGGAPTITPIFCGSPLSDGVRTDTTSNSMNVRRGAMAPASCDITDIVVAIPGSYFGAFEYTMPTPWTVVAASIEYPAGTFYPLFANGSASLAVIPGRTMARFDPCPITVPAGQKFWVKVFLTWTPGSMKMQNLSQWEIIGNWTNTGTDLTDQTQTTTVLPSNFVTNLYGNLMVFGRCSSPQPLVVGFLGDSIMCNGTDQPDPNTGAIAMEKALRNRVPFINISIGGDSSAAYLTRHECRDLYLRGLDGRVGITDLMFTMGRNEISSAAALQDRIATATRLWVNRGVRVHGWTVTPGTTSTDNWATIENQTVSDPASEAQRVPYNAWLRANYQAIGMTSIIDAGRIMDPTDSGKWNCDGTAGYWGLMVPTMNGRAIASVNKAIFNGTNADGRGRDYPPNQTVNCAIYPYPGDTGTGGGAVSLTFTSAGQFPDTAMVSAGGDYDFPPMIVVPGQWAGDGVHPATRGYQEIIKQSGFSPEWFS